MSNKTKCVEMITVRGRIMHPLTGVTTIFPIASVLEDLAAQEGCDGEPYDQMVEAAAYIRKLEKLAWGFAVELDKLQKYRSEEDEH